jgi:hypothetical protein
MTELELDGTHYSMVPFEDRINLNLEGLPGVDTRDKHLVRYNLFYVNNVYVGNIFSASIDDVAEYCLLQIELTGYMPVRVTDVHGKLESALLVNGRLIPT